MDKLSVIVDTREQKPLWCKNDRWTNVTRKKLDVGDYSVEGFEDLISIERKGPMDAFATIGLCKNHARFNKEMERGKSLKYFAVVIELSLSDCYNKNFPSSYRTKLKGAQILQSWVTHSVKRGYPVFFVNNPDEARLLIRSIFKSFVCNYSKELGGFSV